MMLFYLLSLLYGSNAVPLVSVSKVRDVNVMLNTTNLDTINETSESRCVIEKNIKYHGNDFVGKVVPSVDACSLWCYSDDKCKYWTFATDTGRCNLKTSKAGRREGANRIAGNKICGERQSCPKESGFCVLPNGGDQNSGVIKVNNVNGDTATAQKNCLSACQAYGGATGCEVIWDQRNRGCYIHTQSVARGNRVARHACWIFSKCTKECRCNGRKNKKGGGGSSCGSKYRGKKFCYTDRGVCSDGVASSMLTGIDWSYLACQG